MSASELPHASELMIEYISGSWVGIMALTCCGIVSCFKGRYVCVPGCLSVVCTRMDLVGIHATVPWENSVPVWRALWEAQVSASEEPCSIGNCLPSWNSKLSSCDLSVHGAHEDGYLPLFDIAAPEPLCFRSPSAFWCGGVVRVRSLQWDAMCQLCKWRRHTCSTYI